MKTIVYTDLDGSLLDHHTYSPQKALPALEKLKNEGVPVVFCSSKTLYEQSKLQRELGVRHPCIVENGSAVAIPHGYFPSGAFEYHRTAAGFDLAVLAHADVQQLRWVLQEIPGIDGYARSSDTEIAALTGLHGDDLDHARNRMFTETILTPLSPERAADVASHLQPHGFTLSRGGRFYTALSAQTDKGRAVRWLTALYQKHNETELRTIAIGDSPNDAAMLEAVDRRFLVQRFDGSWAALDIPGLERISGIGPAGWCAAVDRLF
ncbi:MAG: HAD-IIB family hydrolase [Saprospiraceae bacterium]|nr:HAD-IIB family hydrolase [Saprospiraceae bacterium]